MSKAPSIDTATVEKMSHLANLKMTSDQVKEMSSTLTKVVQLFQNLSQVDTSGVEPLFTPVDIQLELRADQAQSDFTADEMLSNAPDKTGNLFNVPPVVS
ncbi:MAG: Asp-tRNA(Asn)/Glu-tRNA(Gln) amidotransferase subunit GatC [Pseudobdellovibrionaceae bacterium]